MASTIPPGLHTPVDSAHRAVNRSPPIFFAISARSTVSFKSPGSSWGKTPRASGWAAVGWPLDFPFASARHPPPIQRPGAGWARQRVG